MRPNFIVIGAQKCGTSTLCHLIGQHRDAFVCEPKEPYFFARDDLYERGMEWYESLFEGAEGKRAIGEGSTVYSIECWYPKTPDRIATHLPEVRLLYIVRHPLERMMSHWTHARSRGGRETLSFPEAIRSRPQYIDASRYLKQIDIYRERWPDDRIMVLFLSDMKSDPAATLDRVFRFLEIDPDEASRIGPAQLNPSAGSREDSGLVRIMRRVPGFDRVRDASPTALRDTLRNVLKKPTERPTWDRESWAWAAERLASESRAFCERYGKSADHWSFEFPEQATESA